MNLVQYVCILGMAQTSDSPEFSDMCKRFKSCVQCMRGNSRGASGSLRGDRSDNELGSGSQVPSCAIARDEAANSLGTLFFDCMPRLWM